MRNPYSWFLLACIILGLGLSYYLGSQHYDLPLIERFESSSPQESALLVLKELEKERPTENLPEVMFVGVTPGSPEDIEFVQAFISAANDSDKNRFDVIVVEKNLPMIEQVISQIQLDIKDSISVLAEAIGQAQKSQKRLLIIGPSIYTSQLLAENPIAQIKTGVPTLSLASLSLVKFPITEGQAKSFDPPCQVDAGDVRGTGALGCAILQKSRILWRNLPAFEKYWGRLEKVGPTDYLLLFNRH